MEDDQIIGLSLDHPIYHGGSDPNQMEGPPPSGFRSPNSGWRQPNVGWTSHAKDWRNSDAPWRPDILEASKNTPL